MNKTFTTITIILLLLSSVIFAQEVNNKKHNNNIAKTHNKIEGVTATGDKVLIKDGSTTLLEITNEGNTGSILMPNVGALLPSSNTDKLYNNNGSLFWNGSALGTAGSAGGWTDDGTVIRLSTSTDKVGIGTTTPSAALHVTGDDGVLFEGSYGNGIPLYLGAGTRMMWYPKKAAFRAGYVDGTQWDDANIGVYSTAMGYGPIASGNYSTAMGSLTNANSIYSFAIGLGNVGGGNTHLWIDTDPLFEIGNGSSTYKSNAVTVLKNGNVGIGTTTPSAPLHVTGDDGALFEGTFDSGTIPKEGAGTRMMWYPKKAAFRAGHVDGPAWDDANIGNYSVATGFNTTANDDYSTAMGESTNAWGKSSTAMGGLTTASGDYSTAMGTNTDASGYISTAMGMYTTASGNYSTAMGYFTTSQSLFSVALGQYNVGGGNFLNWIDTDPLFEIGNGTDDTHRANAVTVLKNGNTHISGKITSGDANVSLPIAYGVINTAGSVNNATNNVSCSWVTDHYEITISGESYSQTAYVSTIEVLGTNPVMSSTTASSGNLSVYIYNTSSAKIQSAFHFVVYKL